MICDTCNNEKSNVYFYLDKRNENGRSSTCMACVNKQKKLDRRKMLRRVKHDPRRKAGKVGLILYNRSSYSKAAQKIYTAESTPSFMQFNHLIYKHVKDKTGLYTNEINLLLMLAPITPFLRKEFLACREIMDYKKRNLMKKFMDEGLIYVWRKSNKNEKLSTLYDLTQSGKELISDIYSWAMGEKDIPEVNENKAIDIMAKFYQRRKNILP